ncbi:MAG: PilC/PilY family type IV pilus protein [Betaproteobacteria bacterium]|nr:PilC/PilY family type IV pilus protein [Betaproteobacteria bacterium]
MKTPAHPPRQSAIRMKPLARIVAMAIAIYSGNVLAQTVSFPSVPLTVATAVPANLLYIHDDSNSMYWSFMPDEIHRYSMSSPKTSKVPYQLYMSSEFNKTYYDPAFKYAPPPAPPGVSVYDADGRLVTDGTLGNAKFTDAWFNGYDLATRNQSGNYVSDNTGTITRRFNLASNYTPTDHWSVIFNNSPYNGKIKGSVASDDFTEFLPGAPTGQASYYECQSSAWKNYPTPTSNAANYNTGMCQQRFLTTDEERQNFANWYSYYRTRNYASMAGIGRAFEKLDPSVRVGWGLINKKNSVSIDGKSVNTVIQGVRTFNQARKKQFLEWLYKIQPAAMNRSPVFISSLSSSEKDAGGTPLRRALDHAGRYFDRSDGSSLGPWADNPASPGTAAVEKAAACRKSFTILMTDGYWNSDAATTTGIVNVNVDGSAPSPFKDSYSNTLADIAWYYWNKKLVPAAIANKVPKTPAPEALGAVPPRYRDSAEHPHMTTFTIGLGVTGNIDKDRAFRAIHDSSIGAITWPNPVNDNNTVEKIDDLLHTGVNGHGDFFSATNPDEFVRGMSSIINSVNSAQKASSGNLDASTSQVTSISDNVYLYKTHFKPDDWRGELIAQRIDSKAGLEEEVWFASEQMPAPTERKIHTRSNGNGVPFLWGNLDSTLQNALRGLDQSLNGQNVLEYIRGSNVNEGSNPGQFRPRYRAAPGRAPLGASPHNSPVFVKYGEKQTIFLGANDGMLHAFDASTGVEQFAYIPSALIPKLAELTNGYNSYVDGEVLVTTPTQTPGQYLLVGALGRGAKGLYGLDVSNPGDFQPGHVTWEVSSPQTCPDPDPVSAYLGNVISSLAYAEIDGKPSAVFGNGYNSCQDKAALGIVNVKTGSATFIKASDETGNGLTPPHIWEDTATHKVSAYAGDLRGKMWKFALAPNPGATPEKLFDAGTSQPITARPTAASLNTAPDVKKTYLYFGTGRYFSISDRSSTAQQSLYGLIDENGSTLLLSNLVQRTFGTTTQVAGIPVKAITPLAGNVNIVKGWYLQLAEKGERVVSASSVIQTPNGDVVIFTTIIPPVDGDPCDPRGSGWLYAVNAQTGGALDFVFLDLNGDGELDSQDTIGGTPPAAIKIGDLLGGMPGQARMVNGLLVTCGLDSANCVALGTSLGKGPTESEGTGQGRISWREIVN